ncbi:MAG TPA: lipopolysaccharide biosynthesis protein [Bryobacteraceae bacterium]|nr:lipopolysaccharide biosynthesis protein [Bryobacteraceae bacterium]
MEPVAPPRSLRTNFAWTLAGNAVYSVSQWAVLSLAAKMGDSRMLGEYALAFALALPVGMLSHMNLRAVLATDVERKHPFGDYLAVRIGATLAGIAATAAVGIAAGYRGRLALLIAVTGITVSVDGLSDIYYALMQRRERMDQVATAMVARGILGVAAFGIALWVTGDLIWSVAALGAGRAAVLLLYERPRGRAGETLRPPSTRKAQFGILRAALPLGVVLMLISLTTNMPRYAIERHLGLPELGAFAAVASFATVGNTVVNALGQSATPRLARLFASRNLAGFRRLAFRLAVLALGLGGAGVVTALLIGPFVLRVVYRPEYAAHSGLLTAVMAAGSATYVGMALGFVLTGTRSFGPQMPLLMAVAATCGISAWLLVPMMGLWGGAVAIALAGGVQIIGQFMILRRVLRRAEKSA